MGFREKVHEPPFSRSRGLTEKISHDRRRGTLLVGGAWGPDVLTTQSAWEQLDEASGAASFPLV